MPKIKIKADANKVLELFHAFNGMDGVEKVQNVNGNEQIIRVPYVLGPKMRMAIVRNIVELRRVSNANDEVKKSILKEIWPEAPDISTIPIKDFPPGVFNSFKEQSNEAAKHEDELELFTIDEDQILKNTANEFPFASLSCLIENGLITSE